MGRRVLGRGRRRRGIRGPGRPAADTLGLSGARAGADHQIPHNVSSLLCGRLRVRAHSAAQRAPRSTIGRARRNRPCGVSDTGTAVGRGSSQRPHPALLYHSRTSGSRSHARVPTVHRPGRAYSLGRPTRRPTSGRMPNTPITSGGSSGIGSTPTAFRAVPGSVGPRATEESETGTSS